MQVVTANGAEIPALGFGTWPMKGEECVRAVVSGLGLGYRHVDTAQGYGNEREVGEGIVASGVPRDEVFITTKVDPENLREGELQASIEESLTRLGVDRVDLTLIHWPNPRVPVKEMVGALCDAKRRGLTRHIGLSNFTVARLEEAVAAASEPIATEQIEYHPFLDQSSILAALRRHGISVTAFCPVALGRVVGDPVLERIGAVHGKTAAQVALRWLVQQGDVIAIPKSTHAARQKENLAVFDFALGPAEIAEIDRLRARGMRLINWTSMVPAWD